MKNTKRKELKVSALENGTVIDHITYGAVLQVMRILNLEVFNDHIYIGANLESKKFGKKGIIKVANKYFKETEINKIALVSPTATIIEIENYEITKKFNVDIPKQVNRIVKCINPKCITNIENVPTKFTVTTKHEEMRLICHYCEKYTSKRNFNFVQ